MVAPDVALVQQLVGLSKLVYCCRGHGSTGHWLEAALEEATLLIKRILERDLDVEPIGKRRKS